MHRESTAATTSIRIDGESDEYKVVSVVGVAPTRHDLWAILRGRYRPLVKRRTSTTLKGVNRVLKDVWSAPNVVQDGKQADA